MSKARVYRRIYIIIILVVMTLFHISQSIKLFDVMKKILQEATDDFENKLASSNCDKCELFPKITYVGDATQTTCGQALETGNQAITWEITYPYMLWDPLTQYKTVFMKNKLYCPLCSTDGIVSNRLSRSGEWYNGRLFRVNPRVCFGVDSPTLLVSARYRCSNNHVVAACHPAILQLLNNYVNIPFVLTHRQGFTLDLIKFIEEHVDNGESFEQLDDLIKNQYKGTFDRFETSFQADLKKSKSLGVPYDESQTSFPAFSSEFFPKPSTCLIIDTFLKRFFQNEHLYERSMNALKARSVTLDHTFKDACNVGYKSEDGKWVNQYNSILCVLNENGEVISWQFTGSELDEAEVVKLFTDLKGKFEPGALRIICTDNCCKWKDIFTEKFPEMLIKQNLAHVLQQFAKNSKKNVLIYEEILQEFEAVFRHSFDTGTRREMATPDKDIILGNLENFLQKWNNYFYKGAKVLTSKHINVINELRPHILKGCISGIPADCSKFLGETSHENMKKLTRKKIGIQFAYVKFSRYFFKHNQQLGDNESMDTLRSQEYKDALYGTNLDLTNRNGASFGVNPKSEGIETYPISVKESIERLALTAPMVNEISQSISKIVELEMNEIRSVNVSMPGTGDALQCLENGKTITSILQHALTIFKVVLLLENIWSYEPINLLKTPFLFQNGKGVFGMFNTTQDSSETVDENSVLQNNANLFGFSIVPVTGDGNCFFTSVSFQLLQILSSNHCPTEHYTFLESLGVTSNIGAEELSLVLRELVVNEWLANQNEYQSFFAGIDLENEAERFRRSGEFAGALGDALPIAMANVLNMPIVIFTTVHNMPIISVAPRGSFNRDIVIYLSYTQQGAGHYDALVSETTSTEETLVDDVDLDKNNTVVVAQRRRGCRCGINFKRDCPDIPRRPYNYSKRCTCVKKKLSCSKLCNCNGKCGGVPCGGRKHERPVKQKDKLTRKGRRRELHDIQQVDTCPNSKIFLDSMMPEDTNSPRMNMLEYVIVAVIILYLETNIGHSYVSEVKKYYDNIISFVDKYKILLTVTFKSLSDLTQVLSKILTIRKTME